MNASTASLTCVAITRGANRRTVSSGSSRRITRLPVSSVTPAISGSSSPRIEQSSSPVKSACVSIASLIPSSLSRPVNRRITSIVAAI